MLNLLIYARSPEGLGERWLKLLQASGPSIGIEVYRTLGSFLHRLQHPAGNFLVILLLASLDELREILSVRYLLEASRLVLVLPDQDQETLKAAHRLRPRFLTYLYSDFSDLVKVIGKMSAGVHSSDFAGQGGLK